MKVSDNHPHQIKGFPMIHARDSIIELEATLFFVVKFWVRATNLNISCLK